MCEFRKWILILTVCTRLDWRDGQDISAEAGLWDQPEDLIAISPGKDFCFNLLDTTLIFAMKSHMSVLWQDGVRGCVWHWWKLLWGWNQQLWLFLLMSCKWKVFVTFPVANGNRFVASHKTQSFLLHMTFRPKAAEVPTSKNGGSLLYQRSEKDIIFNVIPCSMAQPCKNKTNSSWRK